MVLLLLLLANTDTHICTHDSSTDDISSTRQQCHIDVQPYFIINAIMNSWINIISVICLFQLWNIHCKTLFFKDLSNQSPYFANHLFRPLDKVLFKDSIMYVPDSNYLMITTNNTIIKFDMGNMNILKTLTVSKEAYSNPCHRDKYAKEYPCHLFGYWSKIVAIPTDSSDKHRLFICHNNGLATYRNVNTFELIPTNPSLCPSLSIISLLSSDLHFYVGDLDRGPKICRFHPEYPKGFSFVPKERYTTSMEPSWIQQNEYLQFVSIFENGEFVYVLLREIADEDKNSCKEKVVKSRIVRISKDDKGGSPYKLNNMWISFVKATIICPDKSQSIMDSSLNYIENAYFDTQRKLLYATFSPGESAPEASAICLYSMTDIENAFDGLFMNTQDPKTPVPKAETSCPNNQQECIYRTYNYQLKFAPVTPNTKRNLMLSHGEIWTHIQVLTIDRSARQYEIIFIATSKGQIKKYFRKLTDNSLCYSETLVLLSDTNNENPTIRDMKLINSNNFPQPFLIVTVNNGVYKIGIEHCAIHSTESSCIDPFCFWKEITNKCTSIYVITVKELRQVPELKLCKDEKDFINPFMDQWSVWRNCTGNNKLCQCRIRNCKYGNCINTDQSPENSEIQVRNCSDLHQWSSWSSWSECSSKCGLGNSTRQRWCFQNDFCPGSNLERKPCLLENQCKSLESIIGWNEWSQCSSKCGKGIQIRTRKCSNIIAHNLIQNDICSLVEFKNCKGIKCQENVKLSQVTKLTRENEEEYLLASCQGIIAENENEMSVLVEYDISNNSAISSITWSCWSEWTQCFNQCSEVTDNLNKKSRSRTCQIEDETVNKEVCVGPVIETEQCEDLCLKMKFSSEEKKYPLVYIIMVGLASFSASCLTVVASVCIYFAKRKSISKYTRPVWQTQTSQRKSFVRGSYSPSQQSPTQSPLDFGWNASEGYTSLSRQIRRPNLALIHMPVPVVSEI